MSDWMDVHAYLDGEMGAEERARFEAKCSCCARTQAELSAMREMRELLQTRCDCVDCTPAWSSCCDRLDEIDRANRVNTFVGRYAWAFCSGLVVMIAAAATMNRLNGADLRTGDVARISASLAPVAAPSSQAPEIKEQWVQDVLSNEFNVQPRDLAVMGGGVGRTENGKRVTRIDLNDGQGVMHLIAFEKTSRVEGMEPMNSLADFSRGKFNTLNCVMWHEADASVFLVGNRPHDELCEIAESIRGK